MNKAKETVQEKWSAARERLWDLRTDFNSALIVISHNRIARALVIAFAALAILLTLLWAGAAWAADQSATQTAIIKASTSSQQLRTLMNNQARLQSQNTALKNKIQDLSSNAGSLAAQKSELERQNGDLSKKFSELSKPS
ncbi:MAG: hypothetical protein FWF33_02015 [Clostridiales bacterium]|nr:hypothetical protein [Clostridiales bacterium]